MIGKDHPLMTEMCKLSGFPPDAIGNWMIHLETPVGTMVFHSMPSMSDYTSLIKRMARDVPVDITGKEN